MRGLSFSFRRWLVDIECSTVVLPRFSLPRLGVRNSSRRERVVDRESVGRRVTWGSLEQRLRRVFLTSLVRSTPRTQSANECRLVSQLILLHPFYREVACERAKCRRLRGRRWAGEGGKQRGRQVALLEKLGPRTYYMTRIPHGFGMLATPDRRTPPPRQVNSGVRRYQATLHHLATSTPSSRPESPGTS